jgi:hypothetical protein
MEVNDDDIHEYQQDAADTASCDNHWSKDPIGENEMSTLKGAHGDESPVVELLLGEDEVQEADISPAERTCPVLRHPPSAVMKNPSIRDESEVMATAIGNDDNDLQANYPTAHDDNEAQHLQDEDESDMPKDPTAEDDGYEGSDHNVAETALQSGRFFWENSCWSCICGKRHT